MDVDMDVVNAKIMGRIPATDEERLRLMCEIYEIPMDKAQKLLEKYKDSAQ